MKRFLQGTQNNVSLVQESDDIGPTRSRNQIEEVESKDDQIRRLTRELEMEKAAHQNTKKQAEPLLNLFQKTRVIGRSFTYNLNIDSLCLGFLSEGLSAPQIHTVFETLAVQFPILLRVSENFEAQLPGIDYIRKLRDSLPNLNELQLEKFLEESEKLTLAVDGSSVSNSKKVTALSLINQAGQTHSLSIKHADAATGREISDLMKTMIAESKHASTIYEKLVAIQSDLCAAQKLANNVFKTFVKTTYGKDIQVIPCCMHLTKA